MHWNYGIQTHTLCEYVLLSPRFYVHLHHYNYCKSQVVLRHLGDNNLDETEVVHAKFVIGADGKQESNAKL